MIFYIQKDLIKLHSNSFHLYSKKDKTTYKLEKAKKHCDKIKKKFTTCVSVIPSNIKSNCFFPLNQQNSPIFFFYKVLSIRSTTGKIFKNLMINLAIINLLTSLPLLYTLTPKSHLPMFRIFSNSRRTFSNFLIKRQRKFTRL